MADEVLLVTGLQMQWVDRYRRDNIELRSIDVERLCPGGDGQILDTSPIEEAEVLTHIVPIVKLRRRADGNQVSERAPFQLDKDTHRPIKDIYIAYSPEVEEVLEMPFGALARGIEDRDATILALQHTAEVRTANIRHTQDSFWRRLKFLFTKKFTAAPREEWANDYGRLP